MLQLLAYLLVRRSDGTWDVQSYRSLESLADAWKAVPDVGACAVIHIGFWRPVTSEFENAASKMPGAVLLTEAAKWAVPPAFRSAKTPCAIASGMFLYEALSGWGNDKEEERWRQEALNTLEPNDGQHDAGAAQISASWFDDLRRENVSLWNEARVAGILDDATYVEHEWRLSSLLRDELALIRFRLLAGMEPTEESVIPNLSYAPPWLLGLNVAALFLSSRPLNRLTEEKVAAVGDMVKLGYEGLRKIPNMGVRSVQQIAMKILEAWHNGSAFCSSNAWVCVAAQDDTLLSPAASDIAVAQQSVPNAITAKLPGSFLSGLQQALFHCEERQMKVLELRMGLHGPKQTLDSVGNMMGVTRERVRQVESKAIKQILAFMQPWAARTEEGVARALDGRDEPLPVLGLEIVDPWFAGCGENEATLAYALAHFLPENKFHFVRIGGQAYVSGINQDRWDEAIRKTKALLGEMVRGDKSMPEDEARCLAESMLSGAGEELRPLLWKETTRWAHFSMTPAGESRLVSFGLSAESIVEAVLLESDRPLHYEEIAKRCSAKGKDVVVRRAHNAAARIGILLAPGTFGLETHFPLTPEEVGMLVSEAETVIIENPSKQWHADEIMEILGERGVDMGGRLNKYILNHALKSSQALAYLGRMVWSIRSGKARGIADRIDVWQAVASALEQNGRPLRIEEIRNALSKDRGLGSYSLMVLQSDPVIKVAEATWGLLWRDIPFSESDARRLTDELEETMRKSGQGLHVSEIAGALRDSASLGAKVKDPILLVSLATRTGRMKAARGGYIHPSDWEGPRRLCSNEAVGVALDEAGKDGWPVQAIAARASGLLGRQVEASATSRMLILAGALYDEERNVWLKPDSAQTGQDEADVDAGEEDLSFFPPCGGNGTSPASTTNG